jgi:phage FluMu protein Com
MELESKEDYKCKHCNKLLFKGFLVRDGHIEIKCKHCKFINTFNINNKNNEATPKSN